MRKLIFLWILFLFSISLFSQEKVLSYNAFGAAKTIESIKATNMLRGKSITITDTNTLILSRISTKVNLIDQGIENNTPYPNPFNGETTIQFNSLQDDNLKVILINSTGQIIAMANQKINPGNHTFLISYLVEGVSSPKLCFDKMITFVL